MPNVGFAPRKHMAFAEQRRLTDPPPLVSGPPICNCSQYPSCVQCRHVATAVGNRNALARRSRHRAGGAAVPVYPASRRTVPPLDHRPLDDRHFRHRLILSPGRPADDEHVCALATHLHASKTMAAQHDGSTEWQHLSHRPVRAVNSDAD
jgi:hypothetical protein